jgi:N-methylhydantoinase A
MWLDRQRSLDLMARLASQLNASVDRAALGIIRVVNSNMERAIRSISLERGYDPRRFTLVPFGGAGPMHCCELAQELGIPRVLVPTRPGILSALGVAIADVVKDYSRTVMLKGEDLGQDRLEEEFHGMENQARSELGQEGLPAERMKPRRFLDVRYVGQSFELTIDCPSLRRRGDLLRAIANRFYQAHLQRFGYAERREPVEVVNLRLKLELAAAKPDLTPEPAGPADPSSALLGQFPVVFPDGTLPTSLYDRDKLGSGNRLQGPALLLQLDTTTLVPPGWGGSVDPYGNLVLEPVRSS